MIFGKDIVNKRKMKMDKDLQSHPCKHVNLLARSEINIIFKMKGSKLPESAKCTTKYLAVFTFLTACIMFKEC